MQEFGSLLHEAHPKLHVRIVTYKKSVFSLALTVSKALSITETSVSLPQKLTLRCNVVAWNGAAIEDREKLARA